jgi:CHAD domain-containing protein
MAYRIKLGPAIGQEIVRVVTEQIDRGLQTVADSRAVLAKRVHVARTSCKRIRAALRLIRSQAPEIWAQENGWFRDAARALAPLRDATVLPQTFAGLLKRAGRRLEQGRFAGCRREILAHRRRALHDSVSNERILSQFAARMHEAARRWRKLKIAADAGAMIGRDFRQTHRRARHAWRHAGARRSTKAFHDYRKRAKTYGYQCRLLRCAWPAMMQAGQGEFSALGDRLGEEHDLAVLDAWLEKNAASRARDQTVAELRGMIRSRRNELQRYSLRLGSRLLGEKAGPVTRGLARGWTTATELVEWEGRSR